MTKSKYFIDGKITANRPVGEGWFGLEAEAPHIAAATEPGQFVQARAWEGGAPLLRRPFSVAGAPAPGRIALLIKKCGAATRIFSSLRAGDPISLIGPLGMPFTPPRRGEKLFLVAGGIGIAPLRFYIERFSFADMTLLFGAKDRAGAAVLDDGVLSRTAAEKIVTTEDGSAGRKGLVSDALADLIAGGARPARILCCGPVAMMKAVAAIARTAGVACEVSMETYMSCGIGVCLGCAVPAAAGADKKYFHACRDGPVMDAAAIDWDMAEDKY